MRVVIAGPRDKEELIYVPLVNDILDDSKNRYSKLLIVTKSCDQGVGKIIRNRCLKAREAGGIMHYRWNSAEFDMIEVSLRHHLMPSPTGDKRELPQLEFQSNFNALNLALIALGDEFHLIVETPIRGSMEDLVYRVQLADAPFALYRPEELKSGAKKPIRQNSQKLIKEVIPAHVHSPQSTDDYGQIVKCICGRSWVSMVAYEEEIATKTKGEVIEDVLHVKE